MLQAVLFIVGKIGNDKKKVSNSQNTAIQCNTIQHKNEVYLYVQVWKDGYNKIKM